ncbi:MAG: outer membrane protein transport protein [Kiritimatiellae bacterium]|nr:outer membrane protein transport protein [Kiritimatiellia bacterium]
MKTAKLSVLALLWSFNALASGFALYEASARNVALGGALVGSTRDATAVYNNPANMGENTNVMVTVGATFVNPFCDVAVNHKNQNKMNAGWFTIPHAYATIPLPGRFAFGIGEYSEYGIGTKYNTHWGLAGDSYETTVEQITTSPVVSFQATDDWSIAAGMRISWIEFENRRHPYRQTTQYMNSLPMPYSMVFGSDNTLKSRLKGDDWALGWLLATQYRITDTVRVGLLYRSPIRHKIKGDFDLSGRAMNADIRGHSYASGKVELPQSITAGVNWDATERLRLGYSMTWTRWSSLDDLNFHIPYQNTLNGSRSDESVRFNWHDVFRFGWGGEYDVNDWFTFRASYQYDMDPSSPHHGTTMMPCGHRHLISTGGGFYLGHGISLDLAYSIVLMESESRWITEKGIPGVTPDTRSKFQTRNGITHMLSASLSYEF